MINPIEFNDVDEDVDTLSPTELREYSKFLQTQLVECRAQVDTTLDLLEEHVRRVEQLYIVTQEGEKRYRQIVESAGSVIYTTNTAGFLTYINPSSQKLTGYSPADLIGAHFSLLIPANCQQQIEKQFRDQLRDYLEETVSEVPILTRSNELVWIEQTVTLLYEDEQVIGFHGIMQDISARKRAEQAQQVSEARSRAFLNAIPDLMMRVRLDGTIVDFRPPRDWDSKSLPNSRSASVYDTFPAEIALRLVRHIELALQQAETTQVDEYSFFVNDERFEHEMRFVACGPDEVLVIGRDVTERKRAEDAFRTTTLRLSALLEDMQAAIMVEDEHRHVALINRQFCELFNIGHPPQKLIGTDCVVGWQRYQHLFANPEQINKRIDWVLRERQGINAEQVVLADGRVLECDYIPIFLGETYRGHLWQFRDITGRKLDEEALRQSEERMRRITDNMLDMVIQTDAAGTIEYASPSCWSVLGYTPEMLLKRSIFFWIHEEDVARVRDAINMVDRVEYRCLHIDGRYLWIETISNLLFDDNGNVTGMVFASRDITERKQAEEQLHKLNQLKSDFLSTAAHELRTPLTSIRGFSEILLTRQLDESRYRRFVNLINDQSNQLGKIIDDRLDVSRLEAGRGLKVTLETVDMPALIQDVITPFVESAPNHVIQMHGFDALPTIMGDPFRLGQVCKNLLSNAIKYSPKGGIITIRAQVLSDRLQIAVHDQGLGMTPDQLSHLFEKFYRANASNTAISGTGLGLAITKLIVELHGGSIWVESEYEQGSTFYFSLPLSISTGMEQS